MAFTHAQATASNSASSGTTLSVVLANNPALGDLVLVSVLWFSGAGTPPAILTVTDGNANVYTKTPNSPSSGQAAASGFTYIFYLVAPSNASKTITIAYTLPTPSNFVAALVDDFTVSGATPTLDGDVTGSGTTGTTVNTPTVPVSGTNELAYCCASPENSISLVNSPWTLGVIGAGDFTSAYILSRSSSVALNMTQASGHWSSNGVSFSQGAAANTDPPFGQGSQPSSHYRPDVRSV